MTSRLMELKNSPKVREWIESYPSEATQKNYLGGLDQYLREYDFSEPEAILDLDRNDIRDSAWELIKRKISEENYATARLIKWCLTSFYDYHHEDRKIIWQKRKHRIPKILKRRSSKVIPTHTQVYQIIDSIPARNLRDKAIISLMYSTGLGPETIINLNYGHTLDKMIMCI